MEIKKVNGDLFISSKADAEKYAALEEVTGYLYISADAQLPVLTSVGGSIYISADAQLPVLTSVGGYLYISADAQLPVLTSVGGYPATMPPICINDLDWPILITDHHMMIGCQWHALSEWAAFDDRRIAEMDGCNAVRFWSLHKQSLLARAVAAGRSLEAVAEEVAA